MHASPSTSLRGNTSQGALRDIDRIATACLKLAAKRKLRLIDRELVARIQQAGPALDDAE